MKSPNMFLSDSGPRTVLGTEDFQETESVCPSDSISERERGRKREREREREKNRRKRKRREKEEREKGEKIDNG